MKTLTKLTLAVTMLLTAVSANAQDSTTYLQPNAWTGGWSGNTYNSDGSSSTTQIRPDPWGGGYDLHTYESDGSNSTTRLTPNVWGGYTADTYHYEN